jgi:hypothetical protein
MTPNVSPNIFIFFRRPLGTWPFLRVDYLREVGPTSCRLPFALLRIFRPVVRFISVLSLRGRWWGIVLWPDCDVRPTVPCYGEIPEELLVEEQVAVGTQI